MENSRMENSDSEGESRSSRSRSRSPRSPRGPTEESHSDEETLSPRSIKIYELVKKAVKEELAPIKRNLNKTLDTTTQTKATVDQVKRGVAEVKMSNSTIEDHLKKAKKNDPKSSLNGYKLQKINQSVFENLLKGKKKEELLASVFNELVDRSVISAEDEDAAKKVAATEFSHVKSHLRSLVSQDLALCNYVDFPKASSFLMKHLKNESISEDTKEFLTIMGLGMVKFENQHPVQLTDKDKANKKKVESHVDFFWAWVALKFGNFRERGDTHGSKMKTILDNCGYQARKGEGAVRRNVNV